jgi:putative phage-type endonuclease
MSAVREQVDDRFAVPEADLIVAPSRRAWLNVRQEGIGSSDAPALWGVSKWASNTSVYVSKVVPLEEQIDAEDEWLEIGSALEGPIADLYAKRTNRAVYYPGPTAIYRSREFPFMQASVDRLVLCPERDHGGVECKNRGAFTARDWDEGVPLDVHMQVVHQMAVTGLRWWSVAALVGGNRLITVDLERDDELIELHVEKCKRLWRAVQRREPPAPDGSEATAEALKALYPHVSAGVEETLPKRALILAQRRLRLKDDIEKKQQKVKQIENWLRLKIGEAEAGVLPDGSRFTLKTVNRAAYEVKASSYRQLSFRPAKKKEQ